jgi:HEPN domain-containing protein
LSSMQNKNDDEFDAEAVSQYWFTEAEDSLTVAGHLVEKGDYSYALFFAHLAIEKELKGLHAVKLGRHAPPIHNLLRLAKVVGVRLNQQRTDALVQITAFNIEARYPDIKQDFRRRCTKEFTVEQMTIVQEMFEWLKSHLTF